MCGRFVSASPADQIASYFGADEVEDALLEPSYNVAPTDGVYVVVDDGAVRRLRTYHWGLVPMWATDRSIGNRMINARVETIAEKNAFRHAYRKRRCIVPADGFYEWKRAVPPTRSGHLPNGKRKQPMYIHRADGDPMAFAGLWEVWRGPERDAPALHTCTIITGAANDAVAPIHDRMPVMLPPSAWETWLDPANDDLDTLGRLLVPAPASLIAMRPVGDAVNNVRNNGPELVEPLPDDGLVGVGEQATLL
jgi:putative SOS response-associated peptidase YedK